MATSQLPDHMFVAYKQYKKDTEQVAGWLVETASKFGYRPAAGSQQCTTQPKLKGRARELARDAAKAGMGNRKYNVTTVDFIKMAETIANARSKTTLPTPVLRTWQRAIRARQQFVEWFSKKDDFTSGQNKTHAHFVDILRRSLVILRYCWSTSASQRQDSGKTRQLSAQLSTKQSDEDRLTTTRNLFEHLELADIAEAEEENHIRSDNTKESGGTTSACVEFDEAELEAEFLFAIWEFMKEMFPVRIYIHSTWKLYMQGKLDLMQATAVVNHAIDLVRQAEASFGTSLARPAKYPISKYPTGTLPSLLFCLHLPNGQHLLDTYDPSHPNNPVMCGCLKCQILLHIPYSMADIYIHVLRKCPIICPGDPKEESFMLPSMKFCRLGDADDETLGPSPAHRAKSFFAEILPDMVEFSLSTRYDIMEDGVLHAVRHMYENHAVPIWVAFALQIHNDIMRKPASSTFDELKSFVPWAKIQVEEHSAWATDPSVSGWISDRSERLNSRVDRMNALLDFSIQGTREYDELLGAGKDETPVCECSRSEPILKSLPLTCGTMKIVTYVQHQSYGMGLLNQFYHFHALCYLLNAIQIVQPDALVWPDIELLINLYGEDGLFVGGRPTDLADTYKKLLLSRGMSPSRWLSESGRGTKSTNANRFRRLKVPPIIENLGQRLETKDTRKVNEAAYKLTEILQNGDHRNTYLESSGFDYNGKRPPNVASDSKGDGHRILTSLHILTLAWSAEIVTLKFDYLAFRRKCWSFFQLLDKQVSAIGVERIVVPDSKGSAMPLTTTMALMVNAIRADQHSEVYRCSFGKKSSKLIDIKRGMRAFERLPGTVISSEQIISQIPDTIMESPSPAAARYAMLPVIKALESFSNDNQLDEEVRKLQVVQEKSSRVLEDVSLSTPHKSVTQDQWADFPLSESDRAALGIDWSVFNASMIDAAADILSTTNLSGQMPVNVEGFTRLADLSVYDRCRKWTCECCLRSGSACTAAAEKEDWEYHADIFGR